MPTGRTSEASRVHLLQSRTDALAARRQLALELVEGCPARADERELCLHVAVRLGQQLLLLRRVVGVLPALAQNGARLLRLEQPLQLLERDPEQVAQPDQLAQARDLGLAVRAVAPLLEAGRRRQQADLLVVADRPRRRPDELGDLADPVRPLGDHAARSGRWDGRSSDTSAPRSEKPASTSTASCRLPMKRSTWACGSPVASPEKMRNRTSLGIPAVTIASTNEIEITAPVF